VSLWLLLGAMTALAAALVAWPLLRPPAAPSGRRDYELRVYRAQLEELARERERGLLGEREAQAAKLEVERRMLAADAASSPQAADRGTARRWAVVALIALLLAAGLYWPFGRPDLPSAPFAGRADDRRLAQEAARGREQGQAPSVESMIARLEQRVAERPDDLEAWQRLGQAFELAGRYDDAVRARGKALALDDGSAADHAALGEALVMANGGTVTPAAAQAFERALALDAGDPRARFYRGLALLQEGDRQGALDAWVALIESSPGDAPWLPELQRRVTALAADLGTDPADLPTLSGPSREQMQAAESMAPEDRAAMVRDMVAGLAARLEEHPGDIEGWRRLGRSYQVLGEPQQAADAYRHVAVMLPDDLEAQLDYADALLAAAPNELSPAAEQQMRRVLALDPQNPAALFYVGQAAAQAGDAAAARAHWQRLIAQVPPDAPERAQIQRMIDQLPPDPGAAPEPK
jgi:cytochrome c-type biogenesis protein CcmH